MGYCVYVHTFPNGKRYVGITSQRPEKRWKNGHAYQNQRYVWNAINKYGWHNIKHDVLYEGLTKFEACAIEQALIAEWKTATKEFGYNLSTGGECSATGHKVSAETRKRMSESHKGKNTWAKGRKNPSVSERCSKAVVCVETNVVYRNGREASEMTGINRGNINQCCLGNRKTARGYHWRYAEKEAM